MHLSLWYEIEDISLDQKIMESLLQQIILAFEGEGCLELEGENFHVILTSDEFIRQLNRDFRQRDCVTDVLSFPLGSENEITGEIYICCSKVNSQAAEYGHSWQREFSFLLVHGILHLLGYEHTDLPNPAMREMEERILLKMGMGRQSNAAKIPLG